MSIIYHKAFRPKAQENKYPLSSCDQNKLENAKPKKKVLNITIFDILHSKLLFNEFNDV